MEYDERIIAALIGVGGLVLAAVLSAAGYFYRSLAGSKRSAKVVLYMLFEIRFVIKAQLSDPKTERELFMEKYKSHLKDHLIEEELLELDIFLGPLIESQNVELVSTAVNGVLERLIEPFENALQELAQESPILAYKLKGVETLLASCQVGLNHIHNCEVKPEELDDFTHELIKKGQADIKQEAIEEIDNNISIVAKKCGFWEWRRSKKLLSIQDEQLNEERYQKLDKYFESVVAAIPPRSASENVDPKQKTISLL